MTIDVGIKVADPPSKAPGKLNAKEERLLELYSELSNSSWDTKVEGDDAGGRLATSCLASISLCRRSLLKKESACLCVFRVDDETPSKARPNNRKVL